MNGLHAAAHALEMFLRDSVKGVPKREMEVLAQLAGNVVDYATDLKNQLYPNGHFPWADHPREARRG